MLIQASMMWRYGAVLCAVSALFTTSLPAESDLFDLNKTAPPAEAAKSFSFGPAADKGPNGFSSGNNSFDKSFATKGADGTFSQSARLNAKEITPPSVTMNKSYAARSYPLPGNFKGFDNATSSVAIKSSTYSALNAPGFNRSLDMPAYTGPEASRAKQDMESIDKTLANTKSLPDRNLSIQEVRDLLNHNAKPSPDAPPPAADKK